MTLFYLFRLLIVLRKLHYIYKYFILFSPEIYYYGLRVTSSHEKKFKYIASDYGIIIGIKINLSSKAVEKKNWRGLII